MRIRRNPSRILALSADATAQVQPKALLPEEPVLPPPAPASPASQVDDIVASLYLLKAGPVKFCLQSCAWTSTHPDTLNPEELNDDDGRVGDAWREPRENPGLSYSDVDFVLQQDEEETESEVEEFFLVKRKKVEDKIGKQQQQKEVVVVVNEKLKRDGNQQKKGSKSKTMKARVVTDDEPPRCKKTDGRKWSCQSTAALPHTLCEKHLSRSRSYYSSLKQAPGPGEGSSKSASQKALVGSGAAPAKASSGSKRARASALPALASNAPARSKAAPSAAAGARPSSKRPQKKKKKEDDYSGGAFYYPEPFGPFRGKQRGHYSSSRPAIVEEEEEGSPQGDASTSEAPEGGVFPEAKLSSKATRKALKIRTLESLKGQSL
ncbi:hypothetical protein PVAP13_9NG747900 [Panicum virgatum]|uniref:WRC domain-containing protein n=1 Tax=Panicum virgatum TaxID=38727 RepID=A0A8T0N3K1_PANVG|nr:hypothetical protein PVAP13_9NG747900 [Panicum virgatum]